MTPSERLKHWLDARQIGLYFLALALGALTGLAWSAASVLDRVINPALAVMLFATFLQIPLVHVGRALKNARFLGALALTQFFVLPILVTGLVQCLPDHPMLRLAVALVLLAPCVDYVITFTHAGQGDARLLLASTPLLLVAQTIALPMYLPWILQSDLSGLFASHGTSMATPLWHALLWLIVVPLVCAGLVQWLSHRSTSASQGVLYQGARLMHYFEILPVPATAAVLFIVMAAVIPQIGGAQQAALAAVPIYVGFAICAPCLAAIVTRSFRLPASAARALAYSASYRNSLVLLPLAFAIPGGTPLIPAVILTQTIVELAVLPLYLRWIPRLTGSTGRGEKIATP